ncbi:conserved hypothetical protein (plasmid) [Trichormus variabilis ATCC 29413]|jgi:hypothetical protein|uniref:Type I restriction enzyme R protein N-terminal domain-containing protein n=2 Tax=Anabaena variabilis TaxID=264691 RepID=Q3M138_TRIV2|nr:MULTISPECIES: hypothetical protein [Nostocaceae]PMB51674.1 hypothetical protein CEN39_13965 [Fischerella thermalis CCMEE 5201]ABA25305.1 conserved hypothetical protein [Trichormus variabilis ATCC 29413]MBC1218213.1 hypothetical protein [Trichormus variabilis ARAD]MBC1259429.1 hypothetical protein [Trichormus variabilis V5]MBC1271053.1 hypothetical protein [Trichormus variabilis FSR]
MSRPPLLDPNRSYTFSNYFELGFAVDDLVAEFGYSFERKFLELPQYSGSLDRLTELKQRIEEVLPFVDLENEATRREILIAPIVTDLIHYSHAKLRIEYNIKVDNKLQGNLDYYLRTTTNLIVIEAKQADINRGFIQLATEMIALDKWTDSTQAEILGAVTTGNVWQFGRLNRQKQSIEQAINLYRVTEELEVVVRTLLAALMN